MVNVALTLFNCASRGKRVKQVLFQVNWTTIDTCISIVCVLCSEDEILSVISSSVLINDAMKDSSLNFQRIVDQRTGIFVVFRAAYRKTAVD